VAEVVKRRDSVMVVPSSLTDTLIESQHGASSVSPTRLVPTLFWIRQASQKLFYVYQLEHEFLMAGASKTTTGHSQAHRVQK
jgi:hypothetical protein